MIIAAAAVLMSLGGLLPLGLPGAVVYELCVPWVR